MLENQYTLEIAGDNLYFFGDGLGAQKGNKSMWKLKILIKYKQTLYLGITTKYSVTSEL